MLQSDPAWVWSLARRAGKDREAQAALLIDALDIVTAIQSRDEPTP
jgi:hypothetical protein